LSELRGQKAAGRRPDRNDQKTNENLGLGPAELLEMVVDRRHFKNAPSGELVRYALDDDGDRLEHKQTADHSQHDLMFGGNSDGAEHAAERERTGVAHENRSGRGVEPEEA